MSEKIVAGNLDEVISKNAEIRDEMREKAVLIRTNLNRMQISSSNRLAMQILKPYGLIQMPIDNPFWSGAIFVKNGKKIPVINTALPRANQYFTAWHEIYHLIYLIIIGVCKTHSITARASCSLQWRLHLCGLFSFPRFSTSKSQ